MRLCNPVESYVTFIAVWFQFRKAIQPLWADHANPIREEAERSSAVKHVEAVWFLGDYGNWLT